VDEKQVIRERVWRSIDSSDGVRRFPGARGRIPNFVGAEAAAARLAELGEWRGARVLKLNPDSPQLPVRARAIEDGKLLYMAVPKLASDKPFFVLERSRLEVPALEAASIDGASQHGVPTRLQDMSPIDLIVCGTVAVNAAGVRVGKGGGYADLEFALLTELGLVGEHTTIATSVHDLQVLEQELPETGHDFRVDLIATPTRLLRCPRTRRPPGIVWDDLDAEKIASIPLLAQARAARREKM
jgi:5-formyltetrahydrofolate cyclo-ligase